LHNGDFGIDLDLTRKLHYKSFFPVNTFWVRPAWADHDKDEKLQRGSGKCTTAMNKKSYLTTGMERDTRN